MRLPKEFRLPGDRVRVRHMGGRVLLDPIASDVDVRGSPGWIRFAEVPLFEDGRNQPPAPVAEDLFE